MFVIASFYIFLMVCATIFFSSGINKWRDSRTPRQILEKYCEVNNFFKPRFLGNNKVIFHGDEFCLEDFGKLASTERRASFPGGGSSPRFNPLHFYIPFWQKRYPFYYLLLKKGTPFTYLPLGSFVLIYMQCLINKLIQTYGRVFEIL